MFQLSASILSQPVFLENVVFKNVFGGQLPALLPVFFGLGAIGLARNELRPCAEQHSASVT